MIMWGKTFHDSNGGTCNRVPQFRGCWDYEYSVELRLYTEGDDDYDIFDKDVCLNYDEMKEFVKNSPFSGRIGINTEGTFYSKWEQPCCTDEYEFTERDRMQLIIVAEKY